jgi:hypothetical protein
MTIATRVGADTEKLRQGDRQSRCCVAAGEVVVATIAFGLAEDSDDLFRRNQPIVDQPKNRGDIAGIAHRDTVNEAFHRLAFRIQRGRAWGGTVSASLCGTKLPENRS